MQRDRQDSCEVHPAAPPQATNPCAGLDVEGANLSRHKEGECERLGLGGRQLISGKDQNVCAFLPHFGNGICCGAGLDDVRAFFLKGAGGENRDVKTSATFHTAS